MEQMMSIKHLNIDNVERKQTDAPATLFYGTEILAPSLGWSSSQGCHPPHLEY